MTLDSNAREPEDSHAVKIAWGSLFVIGIMLWFFSSGTNNELKALQRDLKEVKELLEKQSEALKQRTAGHGENGALVKENVE
ncbi:MAG: hypothetical protein ACK58L_11630 [Planctomycetota bacterium]